MESLRRQLDYDGMKLFPKKEPRLISNILTPPPFHIKMKLDLQIVTALF